MKVRIDGLASAVMSELNRVSTEQTESLKGILKEEAKEAVKDLKMWSPKASGKYAKSWKSDVRFENESEIRISVHNQKYQLTHLLEKGHAKRYGGRVEGIPHISVAEEAAKREIERRVRSP